jgi:hypothetical protein
MRFLTAQRDYYNLILGVYCETISKKSKENTTLLSNCIQHVMFNAKDNSKNCNI